MNASTEDVSVVAAAAVVVGMAPEASTEGDEDEEPREPRVLVVVVVVVVVFVIGSSTEARFIPATRLAQLLIFDAAFSLEERGTFRCCRCS